MILTVKKNLFSIQELFTNYHKALLEIFDVFDENTQVEWEKQLLNEADEMVEITISEYIDAQKIWDVYVSQEKKPETDEERRKMKYASSLNEYLMKLSEGTWRIMIDSNFKLINLASAGASEVQTEMIYRVKTTYELFYTQLKELRYVD